MPIIHNGKIISPTIEIPRCDKTRHGTLLIRSVDYVAHLESLWQSSTIHASPELQEQFKDGEELIESKDYVLWGGTPTLTGIAIPVPLPAVEEGSQDEMWQELIHEVERHQKRETLYPEVIKLLKQQYKLIKI